MMSIKEEIIFYDCDGIQVTSTRCILRGRTYPIANISSVAGVKIKANRKSQWYLLVLYCFIALIIGAALQNTTVTAISFLVAVGLGIFGIISKKVKYAVRINTAGQEKDGLIHEDESKIYAVLKAINEAIIQRG
jgi:Na+/H+ antiporter NhaB